LVLIISPGYIFLRFCVSILPFTSTKPSFIMNLASPPLEAIFSNFKISVSALNVKTTKENIANININFLINSLEQLKDITSKLNKIKGVLSIKRVSTF